MTEYPLEKSILPQTILISGPYGAGQELYARNVIRDLLPLGIEDPDLHIVTLASGKQKISLEDIMLARAFLGRSPLYGNLKVLVVFNADFLSIEAQNALLKSIEEPSSSTKIILVSNYGQLLSTIYSRCYSITIHPSVVDDITWGFKDIKDKFDISNIQSNLDYYLSILTGSLSEKYKYIEALRDQDVLNYSYMLWIWESVHRIIRLAHTDRERYTKYVNVMPKKSIVILEQAIQNISSYHSIQIQNSLHDLKSKLLFTSAKNQILLEQLMFNII